MRQAAIERRSILFDDCGRVGEGPASIVVPHPRPTAPTPPPSAAAHRLAELVGWRDLLGAPGDTTPLVRRPRVLVLVGATVFAFSPLVAALVAPSSDEGPAGSTSIPTEPPIRSTSPLPTLAPTEVADAPSS